MSDMTDTVIGDTDTAIGTTSVGRLSSILRGLRGARPASSAS